MLRAQCYVLPASSQTRKTRSLEVRTLCPTGGPGKRDASYGIRSRQRCHCTHPRGIHQLPSCFSLLKIPKPSEMPLIVARSQQPAKYPQYGCRSKPFPQRTNTKRTSLQTAAHDPPVLGWGVWWKDTGGRQNQNENPKSLSWLDRTQEEKSVEQRQQKSP